MKNTLFILCLFVACAFFNLATAQERELVDIGGYRLDVAYDLSEVPTVVFIAGLGDSVDTWRQVAPAVGAFAATVVYSRAGHGRSERGGPMPRTSTVVANELSHLLDALHVQQPVVLVGHSIGGFYARIFAAMYPNKVAGLVLVDGSHERFDLLWGEVDTLYWSYKIPKILELYKRGSAAVYSELYEFEEVSRVGDFPLQESPPDVPIAVLSGIDTYDPTNSHKLVERKSLWRRLHDDIFADFTVGLRIVSKKSGHLIHKSEPELVIDAIEWVVDRVKTNESMNDQHEK